MFKVYLAGPITGLTYAEARQWRKEFSYDLPESIKCYCPLRGKNYLSSKRTLTAVATSNKPLSTSKGILSRDHFDVMTCDVLVVNFIGATRVSIGTVAEIAWAYNAKKPIVLIMDKDNIHDHDFINEMADFTVQSLNEAKELVKTILLNDDDLETE